MIGALCSTSDPKQGNILRSEKQGAFSAHHRSISVGYRYQHSFRHFVGTTEQTQRETQHTQVVNYINLFDAALTYSVNPRWSMTVSMPIMNATRTYDHQLFQTLLHIPNAPDQVSHSNGIGDIGVSAQFWVLRPPSERGHNIAFSFGTVARRNNCRCSCGPPSSWEPPRACPCELWGTRCRMPGKLNNSHLRRLG